MPLPSSLVFATWLDGFGTKPVEDDDEYDDDGDADDNEDEGDVDADTAWFDGFGTRSILGITVSMLITIGQLGRLNMYGWRW